MKREREEFIEDLCRHSVHDSFEEHIVELLKDVPTMNRAEEHLLRLGLEGKAQTPLFHDAVDGRSFVVLIPLPPTEPRKVSHPVLWYYRSEMLSRLQARGCAHCMGTYEVAALLCGITGIDPYGAPGDCLGLFRSTYPELSVHGEIEPINQADELDVHWYALSEVEQGGIFWVFDADA